VDLVAKVGVTITGDTWLERLERALSAFLDASLDPEVRRMIIDGPAVLGWDGWREIEVRFGLGAIRQMVGDGVAEGSIVEVDADAMAHLLLSVIDEAALFIAHADDPTAARVAAGASVAALIVGLAPS
jgi:hypothetical protein